MAKFRVDWIDTAKGVSIVLVTFLHVVQLSEALGLPVGKLVKLNAYLSPIRMPLFFAVAGVFAGKALAASWPRLLRKKVTLYLWLILIWATIRWATVTFAVPNPDNPTEGGTAAEILYAFVAPTTGTWFLWSLAIFFVTAKLLTSMPKAAAVALAAAISIGSVTWQSHDQSALALTVFGNVAYKNSLLYFLFFLAAATFPQWIFSAGNRPWWVALMLGFACICLFVFARRFNFPVLDGAARVSSSIAGVASVLIASRLVSAFRAGALLTYLGKNTLPIYVAQVPVICVFMALIRPLVGEVSAVTASMMMVAVTALVIAITLAIREGATKAKAGWLYRLPTPADLPKRRGLAQDAI